jgi:large repetitive protein
VPDGSSVPSRVLIIGGTSQGITGAVPLASAELWNSANGTFTATGSLTDLRGSNVAVRPPGPIGYGARVFVIGSGSDGGSAIAEVWDPDTGTFSATGTSTLGVTDTATPLAGDGIFVTGTSLDGTSAGAEAWDSLTGAFAPLAVKSPARSGATATSIHGEWILIAGGAYVSFADPEHPATDVLATSELWDGSALTPAASGRLLHGRTAHTATYLDDEDRVVLIGGAQYGPGGEVPQASAELFEPATGTFTETGSLGQARWGHTATIGSDGRLVVIGGMGDSGVLASVEAFDPGTGTFSVVGHLCEARYLHTATELQDGRILIAGGIGDAGPLASVEIWDPYRSAPACAAPAP